MVTFLVVLLMETTTGMHLQRLSSLILVSRICELCEYIFLSLLGLLESAIMLRTSMLEINV